MPLLEAEGITAGYGDSEILHDVHLRVDEGEIVALIGPNGAGKSTLMKAVFGLVTPRRGSIRFRDREIAGHTPYNIVKEGMCYVPQVANVFTQLTAEENLEMGGYLLDVNALPERKERVYALFPKLRERRHQRVGKMSGGERQMVAIGSALMLDPALLLLDEPSAGLSPKLVDEIFANILHINETGLAILMVEQNARKALAMATRGYVLASGQNRVDGPGQELLDDPEVGRLYLGG